LREQIETLTHENQLFKSTQESGARMLDLDRQVVDLGIERDSLKAILAHKELRVKELEAEVAIARAQSETQGEEREHSHDMSRDIARLRAERENLEKELERL